MATKQELELKVDQLTKELDEMRDAIRNISTQSNQVLEMVGDLSKDLSAVKVDLNNVKLNVPTVGKATTVPTQRKN